jgi:hypothetical protein
MEEIPMKRIALVLAAAFLGTGCFVSSDTIDYGSVNIYWDFLRTAPAQGTGFIVYDESDTGAPDGACNESGVEVVEVTSPLGTSTVSCVYSGVEGIGLDGIAEGVPSFRFRAWRGAYLVYDTSVSLQVVGDATTNHFVDLHGVSAPLDVYGDLYNGATSQYYADCLAATPVGSASPPYFGYEIRDVFGSLVVEGTAGCAAGLPAPVFVGDLELDNFTVRMSGYRAEDDALVFDSCPAALDHFVAQIGPTGRIDQVLTTPVPISCP